MCKYDEAAHIEQAEELAMMELSEHQQEIRFLTIEEIAGWIISNKQNLLMAYPGHTEKSLNDLVEHLENTWNMLGDQYEY